MKQSNIFNQMIHKLTQVHLQCIQELEQYSYYMTRCLKEKFQLNECVNLLYNTENGIAQAVVYPKSSITETGKIINPMFFYGYIFSIQKDGIHLAFTEEVEEFEKLREKL